MTDDLAPLRSRRKESRGYCGHNRVELDYDVRRVYCRDCGEEIPAFDALRHLTVSFERYEAHRDYARSQAKMAEARLNELKKLERNARARLRRIR